MRNSTHTGPIRGLDFNPIQTNLIASGAVSGEVRAALVTSMNFVNSISM
jgi:hypothetical protein